MNLHEYQAKSLLKTFALPVPIGAVAISAAEAVDVAKKLAGTCWVVKAQIHAGGRGKAGGVTICKTLDEVHAAAEAMLGSVLVTEQTGAAGKLVQRIYVEQASTIVQECYLSLLVDRDHECLSFVMSPDGGMDIETVASTSPERILTLPVGDDGLRDVEIAQVAQFLTLPLTIQDELKGLLAAMVRAFWALDASLIEINPLVLTEDNDFCLLDAKVSLDDNGLYRHGDLQALRDLNEEDPLEVKASAFGLNYIALEGDIGCMVNGAGLAMATMDMIQMKGAKPANFLDVGGGVTEDTVTEGFHLLFSNPHLKAVLVNIFGGIVRCDIIANGLIRASAMHAERVPVVLRLVGTHEQAGREIIEASGLDVRWANNLDEAATLAAAAVGGNA
ncbi:MAG: ADP-forming succinate--CoA ligase subunit beta [Zetaproteobacteria bacterium]|nr:ADP-forming succinate--CoA ligase subunit beta [Zetaproteobacteria bacterium]